MKNSLFSYVSIISFLIIADAHTFNNANTFVCPPGTYLTAYPYPGDCTKYFECNNGIKTLKECAQCTVFDKNRSMCYIVEATRCDNGNTIDYNVNNTSVCKNSPTKYIICANGRAVVKDCDPEEYYSISRSKCLPMELVPPNDRVEESEDKIYCPKDLFGIFPYPFSNKLYFKCVYGDMFIKKCRPGEVYNYMTKFCEELGYNDMESGNQFKLSQRFIECPPGLIGTFLYPFNCTKYINCTSAGTSVETCTKGKYSIKDKGCITDPNLSKINYIHCAGGRAVYSTNENYLGVNCSRGLTLYKAYPHPSNWKKYVVCENNLPKIKTCPENQVFEIKTRECSDKPENETDERK